MRAPQQREQRFCFGLRPLNAGLFVFVHVAADEAIDYKDLRRRAAMVLTVLRHHQAVETDLIFETFVTRAGSERLPPPPPKGTGKNPDKLAATP